MKEEEFEHNRLIVGQKLADDLVVWSWASSRECTPSNNTPSGLLLEEPAEVFSRCLAVWDGGCHRAEEKGAFHQQCREGEE